MPSTVVAFGARQIASAVWAGPPREVDALCLGVTASDYRYVEGQMTHEVRRDSTPVMGNRMVRRLRGVLVVVAMALGVAIQSPPAIAEGARSFPVLPDRVIAAPFYNGRLRQVYTFFLLPFHQFVRELYPDVQMVGELYRHRSLPLGWRSGSEEGLMNELRRSAEEVGWREVRELRMDGAGLYQALGFQRRGEVLYVLALGDPFAADSDNPGVNLDFVFDGLHGCEGDGCTGFAPVFVWSTISDRDPRRRGPPPWISPDAPYYFDPDWNWTEDTTWAEVLEAVDQ